MQTNKFNLVCNPFAGVAYLSSRVEGVSCDIDIPYNGLGEYQTFEMNGKFFEICFSYDSELVATILDLESSIFCPVRIKITDKLL